MSRGAAPGHHVARRCAAAWLVMCALATVPRGSAAQGTAAVATAAPAASAAAPVPLSEVSQRADDLVVYLRQLEERLKPGDDVATIEHDLQGVGDRIRLLSGHTLRAVAASPALREVDELLRQWQDMQDILNGWAETVTGKLTALDAEVNGLGDLRDIWQATREAAQADGAPPAVLDRIRATLTQIEQTRKQIDADRGQLLVLQDRIVQASGRCREIIDQLTTYRRTAVGRLLVRDEQPIWLPEFWEGDWSGALSAYGSQMLDAWQVTREYLRVQLPRVPLHVALFAVLLFIWWRARQRTARWLQEDDSLASVAAAFEHPLSSALFLALLVAPSLYPQVPLLLKLAIRVAAVPPLLRVLDRLVDRPILPGLYALGAFFMLDQLRTLASALPHVEQIMFLIEMAGGVAVLVWLVRSGRVASLRPDLPRVSALLERIAIGVIVLFAIAFLAAALGFMQLAGVIAGAVLGSGYAAMLLFAMQRFAQGVWAYLLRTAALRRLRMVQHHRALLQNRGDRLLSWLAAALWLIATLTGLDLYQSARDGLYRVLTATLAVGEFSVSFGDVLALVVTMWLAFLLSRFLRFVLEEEVYPRIQLPRGMPYALATLVHYLVLLVGFFIGLAAAGLKLDRFALLAGAFGVGIGFGMQNIVNNFVSGLILLFERPLQVGDTVQIGTVYGEIRRIGIRSSTVRTFEGAEVIVPNGTLIADPVTNWTLSDRMRRIDVPVSVAYGSEPDQVLELLRSVAAAHSLVVKAPAPTAIFLGFGETALSFELRAWTDRSERWVQIRSELAIAVFKALTDGGIAIPVAPREPYRGPASAARPAGDDGKTEP